MILPLCSIQLEYSSLLIQLTQLFQIWSLWWWILTANHLYNLFYHILECPNLCECNVLLQTIISVNCSGKNLNSFPWKFPPAMSKLWVPLNSCKYQEKNWSRGLLPHKKPYFHSNPSHAIIDLLHPLRPYSQINSSYAIEEFKAIRITSR